MSIARNIERTALGGGELSEAFLPRMRLQKHGAAVRKSENYIIDRQGVATRAPGTRFIDALKTEAQKGFLMPFDIRASESLMLVLNGGKGRVLKGDGVVQSGGSAYEFDIPWSESELDALRWVKPVDVAFVAWGGQPKRISRYADDNFVVDDYEPENGPVRLQNIDKTKTMQADAVSGSGVTITTNFDIFEAGHVGSVWRLDEADYDDVAYWQALENIGSVTPYDFIDVADTEPYPLNAMRRYKGNVYVAVRNPDHTGASEGVVTSSTPPEHTDGEWLSGMVTTVAGSITYYGPLWRFVHKGYGYFKITAVTDAQTATVEVLSRLPDSCVTKAGYRWYEPAWSDARGWPTDVFMHEQRLCWIMGDEYYLTQPNDYYNFEQDGTDTSAITFRINSPDGTQQEGRWGLSTGVIVTGTQNTEWLVRAPGDYQALTGANVRALPDESKGSAAIRPAFVEGGFAFVGRNRKRLHYMRVDRLSTRIAASDMHIFNSPAFRAGIAELAWQQYPHNLLWVRMDDGTLRAVTFDPSQELLAIHRHRRAAGGLVERIACKPDADGRDDELWMIVQRQIDGVARRYVERLQPLFEAADEENPDATGAWFCDCALRYQGAAASTISGFVHLEGQDLRVFADGRMVPDTTVSSTEIVMQETASDVIGGLPLDAFIEPMPIDGDGPDGTTQGDAKTARSLSLYLYESAGGKLRFNNGKTTPVFEGNDIPPGGPAPLASGRISPPPPSLGQGEDIALRIINDDAYPFTLCGLVVPVDISQRGRG